MKRFCFLLLAFFGMGAAAGFAQSNSVIDGILDQQQADFSTAVYLVFTAAGIVPDTATPEDAVKALEEKGWGLEIPAAPSPISLGQYSFILMKAFDIPGGLMYRAFPGPRYAVREAQHLGFVTDRVTPYRTVSGEEAMRILGSVLTWKEERS